MSSATNKPALPRVQQGERSPDSVYHNFAVAPGPAYTLQRNKMEQHSEVESLDYSSRDGSESYLAIHEEASVHTGQYVNHSNNSNDATDTISEIHVALLYLLSNPEEFQRALAVSPPRGATTLAEWNMEYESESVASASVYTDNHNIISSAYSSSSSTPLPFVVFADDAEVVLPQAHTVSQLFGVEMVEGIELEAAAGIPAISQLFLRWLALMPGGDHLNLIDPPGLTVMRIAGGRYRVTAAHRVVWTWMNSIAGSPLQPGDLVTMTIVDVFETDNQGKLLSYCPTFDNREIHKTYATAETLRKSSTKLLSAIQKAQKSKLGRLLAHKASHVAKSVQLHIQGKSRSSSPRRNNIHELSLDLPEDSERHEV